MDGIFRMVHGELLGLGGPNLCAKPGWCLDVFGFEVIDSYNSVIKAIQTIVACEPSTNNWLYSDMIRVRIF